MGLYYSRYCRLERGIACVAMAARFRFDSGLSGRVPVAECNTTSRNRSLCAVNSPSRGRCQPGPYTPSSNLLQRAGELRYALAPAG